MKRKICWIVPALLLSAFALEPALASGSMRCGSHIISPGRDGPGRYEVLKKCGEPTARSGDTWVYEQPRGGKRVLRFDASGNLTRVE
ncbi:MAG: DUF2845 domain-containing protein [Chromatiales bacterium]|jgi:hypothetical protein|nr:DUF2845 domain-containing protein [Chromatiales bacterium]